MDRNAIFICFDDGFARYARACLNSLACNYPDHPELLVYYPGQDPTTDEFLDSLPRLTRLPDEIVSMDSSSWPLSCPQNDIVYRRYCLWGEAFDAYHHILHLDVDTLVLGPLDPLFKGDDFFITCNHYPGPEVRVFKQGCELDLKLQELLARDGLTYPADMDDLVNAGIFVIPRRYRNAQSQAELIRLTHDYSAFLAYADQSAISLWCQRMGVRPSARFEFNYQSPFFTDSSVDIPFDDVRILHFSNIKPDTELFMHWDLLGDKAAMLRETFEYYLS